MMMPAVNGVVIATEKKLTSPLMDPDSVQKICMLTDNIGVVYSGMGAWSRGGHRGLTRARRPRLPCARAQGTKAR